MFKNFTNQFLFAKSKCGNVIQILTHFQRFGCNDCNAVGVVMLPLVAANADKTFKNINEMIIYVLVVILSY